MHCDDDKCFIIQKTSAQLGTWADEVPGVTDGLLSVTVNQQKLLMVCVDYQ